MRGRATGNPPVAEHHGRRASSKTIRAWPSPARDVDGLNDINPALKP